jgi:hypothetical protein
MEMVLFARVCCCYGYCYSYGGSYFSYVHDLASCVSFFVLICCRCTSALYVAGVPQPCMLQVYLSLVCHRCTSALYVAGVPQPCMSQVYLSSTTGASSTAGNLEKIIDCGDWVSRREYQLTTQLRGGREHPKFSSHIHLQRVSRKIAMKQDEFRYMEAYYTAREARGIFSAGVKVSVSTVNRRDSVFGVDEKQIIQISATAPTYELHNFSFPNGSSGSMEFRVKVGGKYSRPLRANATDSEFLSALRELFSDCEGTGAFDDGGGHAWDCWQGRGYMYRGLVRIASDISDLWTVKYFCL